MDRESPTSPCLMRLSHLFCFPWHRPRKSPPTGSRDAPPVPLPFPPPPIARTPQLDSMPHLSAHPPIILEHSNPTPMHSPPSLIVQSPAHLSPPTNLDLSGDHTLLGVPQSSQMTVSQQSLLSPQLMMPPPHQLSPHALDINPPVLYNAQSICDSRNVSVDGNMNTVTYMNTVVGSAHNSFMKELLEKTIPGAAFDSSARDPPPRCHPGTRLAILVRCIDFITNCSGAKKMRWVVGAAGVGKSAIMQSVAESTLYLVLCRASIFFFVNGRNDGTKAIVTLAYQLAAKYEPYHQFIEHEVTRDPSLLHSSMSVQFNKFIVEPFIHHPRLNSAGRVLIILDGLDECEYPRTQRELLRLISDFCLTYPSSPIVWMIASRPEAHITSFFAQASIEATYEKEEIPVDSNEAREDVERFLRIELRSIQNEYSLQPRAQWPSEQDFWKLANAAGGLFVYAQTVIKYIGDPDVGDPTLQLNDVLQVIDTHLLVDVPREAHPLALLDALYSRILSRIPTKVRENMRKLLLALVADEYLSFHLGGRNFIVLCNWLGMTCDEAYAAIRHLSAVLDVPGRDTAHMEELRYLHKSFIDYISDFSRSGFSRDIKHEAHQLYVQCTFRILKEAPDGIDAGDFDYTVHGGCFTGILARGPGTGRNISLTWSMDEEEDWDDNRTRFFMYKMAFKCVGNGIEQRQQAFCTAFCIHLLITRFQSLREPGFPNLDEVVFDKSRHHEFVEGGIIKQIPAKMINFRDVIWDTRLQFRRPATNLSDPWNASCTHEREGEWDEGKDQAWSTRFWIVDGMGRKCNSCCRALERQLKMWKTRFPDYPVSVLFTSAGISFVEFRFVDVDGEDGKAEWTYWLLHWFSQAERKKLGSRV